MSSNAVVDFMVEITGDRLLKATLEQLSTRETRRAARKALTSGTSVLTRALKAAVPAAKTPGHSSRSLQQSIRGRQKRNKRSGIVEAKVGIGVGRRKYSEAKGNLQRAPHLHLIALGTGERYTGQRTYRVRGQRKMRRKDGTTYTLGRHASGGRVAARTNSPRHYRGRMHANPFIPQTASRLDRALTTHMADVFVQEIEAAARRLAGVAGN